MSASSSSAIGVSTRTMKGLWPKLKTLKLFRAADALRDSAVTLLGLKETLSVTDQGCLDLIDRVQILTDGILKYSRRGKANALQDDEELALLAKVVDEISSWIENIQKAGTSQRLAGVDHNSKRLARYNIMLDDIYSRVQLGVSLDIRSILKNLDLSQDTPSSTLIIPNDVPVTELPPNPTYVYGRDEQLKFARESILDLPSAHLAVLGGGGMGKTTFAVTLLHDEAVISKFGRHRIFVVCESVTTADGIVSVMLNMLSVSARDGVTPLQALILYLRSLHPGVFLVLDNLESAWDTVEREVVEALLTNLCNIPTLALMITMRGNRTPNGQRWLPFPPLDKLSLADARSLFMDISGVRDDRLDELLNRLDGLPLAVTLMASLGKSTTGLTPSKLLHSYINENTGMVQTGINTRLSSLDVSIMVSLNCRAMQENPEAFELLKLLALLPDGVGDEDLKAIFPEMAQRERAARALRGVALATYVDNTTRVLAPIRAFMQARNPPTGSHLVAMRNYYIRLVSYLLDFCIVPQVPNELLSEQTVYSDSLLVKQVLNIHSVLAKQMANLHSVLLYTSASPVDEIGLTPVLAVPVLAYRTLAEATVAQRGSASPDSLSVRDYLGLTDSCDAVVSLAGEQRDITYMDLNRQVCESAHQIRQAVLYRFGGREGMKILNASKTQYTIIGDLQHKADCLCSLALILGAEGKQDQAEAHLKEAKEAYRDIGDRQGVAQCLSSLASILAAQGKYDQATSLMNEAMTAYEEIGNRFGVANCLRDLGEILDMQGQYDQAERLLNDAKEAYTDIGNRQGVALCLFSLGNMRQAQGDYYRALQLLNEAKAAFVAFGDRLSVAECLGNLGSIQRMQGQYGAAASLLNEAIAEHTGIGSQSCVAWFTADLGQTRQAQGRFDEARNLYAEAMSLFKGLKLTTDAEWCQELLRKLSDVQGARENASKMQE